MREIADLLAERADVVVHNNGLTWGASASAYTSEIREALACGRRVAVIELADDLPTDIVKGRIAWIDHHGEFVDRPTSIEQVFRLLNFPPERWTRDLTLVAANDRGHIRGLLAAGATPEEISDIRARDRAAQGITAKEESQGSAAASRAVLHFGGRLTIVRLPHDHTATVTDALDRALGGAGYENLVVLSHSQTVFFGCGSYIGLLRAACSGGWFGGDLPEQGFWGIERRLSEAELINLLEKATVTKSAGAIEVQMYRQILFWPLMLKQQPAVAEASPQLERWFGELRRNWGDPVPILPSAITPPQCDTDVTFEEIVYFHSHVRDFLYSDGDQTSEPTLQRLKRTDVRAIEIQFTADGPTLGLEIARLELYICKPQIALMVLEVHCPKWSDNKPFMLDDALVLQSQIRQVHPPFFFPSGTPGNCPYTVTLLKDNGKVLARSDFHEGRDHFAGFTHMGAEPPVASHWKTLLDPLKPFPGNLKDQQGRQTTEGTGLFYQQIEDDRMPGMTFLTVPAPREIGDGDYDRLTWCDSPGVQAYPYAGTFLNDRRDHHVYDRYWDGRQPNPMNDYDTRYLCSGYQFVVVGRDDNPYLRNVLWDHFRRHYFRMGLILHCQRSALLKFQDDLSDAVKLISGQSTDQDWSNLEFRRRIANIQMAFLKFRTRVGFTEVSNQLQGRDLFTWWMGHLGTGKLFAQVDSECARLHSALAEFEARELSKTQTRLAELQAKENEEMKDLTRSQAKLAKVAGWGLGITIFLSALAAGFAWAALFPEENRNNMILSGSPIWGPWAWLLVIGLAFAVPCVGILFAVLVFLPNMKDKSKRS